MNRAVVDLQFGDAGKGTTVEAYTDNFDASLNVRYSGGYNAAHHVVLSDGRFHCFSTFGSGTLLGAQTYLSRRMLFNPLAAQAEAEALEAHGLVQPLSRLTVSPDCLIVTPLHGHLSKMREVVRGQHRKGSCGKGIGEALLDSTVFGDLALKAADLYHPAMLRYKLKYLWLNKLEQAEVLLSRSNDPFLGETFSWLSHPTYVDELIEAFQPIAEQMTFVSDRDWLNSHRNEEIIWEGSQGTLLDSDFGFYPYITKSRTTTHNLFELLDQDSTEVTGVLRAYFTRHGRGPFPTEDRMLTSRLPDVHNLFNPWQEDWRVGWPDLVLLKYALAANRKIDCLAVTNLDRLASLQSIKVCVGYRPLVMTSDIERLCSVGLLKGDPIITGLQLPADRDDQERLTNILSEVTPVYHEMPWNETQYLDFLSTNLGKPVVLTSHGPTLADKVWTPHANRL